MNVENAWAVVFRSDPFIHHPEATIIIRQKKILFVTFMTGRKIMSYMHNSRLSLLTVGNRLLRSIA